jgi:hypothetical protein
VNGTRAVDADVLEAEPEAFDAVTRTRSFVPASVSSTLYVESVANSTSVQLDPLQRCHWYANEIGGDPRHVPGVAVSVRKRLGVPAIAGRTVLEGARTVIGAVSSDAAAVGPVTFDALTIARTVEPVSAAVRV